MSSQPVRVVVLGNSHATAVQLPALDHTGRANVVGIAGANADKAAAAATRWNIANHTDQWRDLLELDADLVIVATPVDLHHEMTVAALDSGAAVLCEKPFTLDTEQAADLAARRTEKLAVLGHQLRWNPCRRQVRQLCADGYVGEIQHIRADLLLDTPGFAERPFTWWSDADRGGGVLRALGVHLLDNLQWMFGPVEAVSARLETLVREREDGAGGRRAVTSDDYAELRLRLAGGLRASITTSMALRGAGRWTLEIAGTDGSLRLDNERELQGGPHGAVAPLPADTSWYPPEQYGIEGKGAFAALDAIYLRDVVAAVADGRAELAEAATFADGLRNVAVLECALESAARDGVWIDCPDTTARDREDANALSHSA